MSEIEYVNHVSKGLSYLPAYWNDKPNATKLLTVYLERMQGLEDLLQQLNTLRSFDAASGVQVDILGALFNVKRNGRSDSAFKTAILERISTKGSSGTTHDIEEITKIVTSSNIALVFNHYPASTYVFVDTWVSKGMADAIQAAHAAGVSTRVIWYDGNDYFVPGDGTDDPVLPLNVLLGYGTEDGEFVGDGPLGEFNIAVGYTFPADLNPNGLACFKTADVEDGLIPDGLGKLAAISPNDVSSIETGLVIDNDGNYVISSNGNYIRYIKLV